MCRETSKVPASLHTLAPTKRERERESSKKKYNFETPSDDVFSFNYHVFLQQQPNINPSTPSSHCTQNHIQNLILIFRYVPCIFTSICMCYKKLSAICDHFPFMCSCS